MIVIILVRLLFNVYPLSMGILLHQDPSKISKLLLPAFSILLVYNQELMILLRGYPKDPSVHPYQVIPGRSRYGSLIYYLPVARDIAG